jgi:hypothetical protein
MTPNPMGMSLHQVLASFGKHALAQQFELDALGE